MRLQDELAGTENRISVARKRYNDSLQDYNTFMLQFPNSIWAGMAGFKTKPRLLQCQPGGAAGACSQVLTRLRKRTKGHPAKRDGLSACASRSVAEVLRQEFT